MAARTRVTGQARVAQRLQRYERAVEAAYWAALQDGAARITEWERGNHRWQNRTGNAERGLLCTAHRERDALRLENGHGVPYGKYLEFGFDRRFAILREALRRHWFAILRDAAARQKALRP